MLPLLPLLSLWRWFCIDWVNLTGDRALVVLVTARVLNMAVAAPLLDLLAEAVGQSLIRKRQRSAEGTLVLERRKGAGQLLTIIRVIGLAAAVTVWVQGAPSLGLTSITILAMSSVPALAMSLGTQQLIRNISDGFSLFWDGQPKVGDQCSIGTPKSGQVDLQGRAQALLTETKDLARAEAHLVHGDGGWWLHVKGRWSAQLTSADMPQRRDRLFLALHGLVTALEAGGSPPEA